MIKTTTIPEPENFFLTIDTRIVSATNRIYIRMGRFATADTPPTIENAIGGFVKEYNFEATQFTTEALSSAYILSKECQLLIATLPEWQGANAEVILDIPLKNKK